MSERTYSHSRIQLFRFSAVSWNSHRIHYDGQFARAEGFGDVVVQSTLHGEMLARHALDWAGPGAALESVSWRNQATAVAGEPLTWTAQVTAREPAASGERLFIDAAILNAAGAPCVTGALVLVRP